MLKLSFLTAMEAASLTNLAQQEEFLTYSSADLISLKIHN